MLGRVARHVGHKLSSFNTCMPAFEGLAAGRGICNTSTCSQQLHEEAGAVTSPAAPGNAAQPGSTGQGLFAGVPKAAKILGVAGAIPFLALTPQLLDAIPLLPDAWVANAPLLQITYGASIASFLGGIHWAMAMAEYGGRELSSVIDHDRYLWSVTPCILACPAIIMPTGPGATVITLTLAGCYLVDRRYTQLGALPPWYMRLRLPLTIAATTGMGMTVAHYAAKDLADAQRTAAERAESSDASQQQ